MRRSFFIQSYLKLIRKSLRVSPSKAMRTYCSPIPIASCNKKAQVKTKAVPNKPIIKGMRRLDITQESIAREIPIIDKALKMVIPKKASAFGPLSA